MLPQPPRHHQRNRPSPVPESWHRQYPALPFHQSKAISPHRYRPGNMAGRVIFLGQFRVMDLVMNRGHEVMEMKPCCFNAALPGLVGEHIHNHGFAAPHAAIKVDAFGGRF